MRDRLAQAIVEGGSGVSRLESPPPATPIAHKHSLSINQSISLLG